MFGRNKVAVFKPVPFGDSYRKKRSVPPWVWIVSLGGLLGAGIYHYVQQEILPPRLSLQESMQLRSERDEAVGKADKAAKDLAQAQQERQAAQKSLLQAQEQRSQALAKVEPLNKELALFLKTLPPDPRGQALAIRAAQFQNAGGKLNYHVLLTQESVKGQEAARFEGVAQIVVTGSRGGPEQTLNFDPVKIALQGHQHVMGELDLPAGFSPREVTVRVSKTPGGAVVSLRVFRLG